MNPSSGLFEAFLKCPTKCYLRSVGEVGSGNAYAEWAQVQNDTYRTESTKRLMEEVPEAERAISPPTTDDIKAAKWRVAKDVHLQAGTLESRLHAVERFPSEGRGRPAQFATIRFIPFNKLTKDDRLLVAFDALVLSEAVGREVRLAKIIHGDGQAVLKVKIASPMGTLREQTGKMQAVLTGSTPPDLVLNRYCTECEFRDRCRQKALEKDDLSLLSGMAEKERKEYHATGIFTVTQLSFTFRPRRRPKRLRDKRERYHHSLKALAIREKKIHIVGSPELKIEGTPVYLDVEGIPDRAFYYLIGIRVREGDSVSQHSLWADTLNDERTIWHQFLEIIRTVANPTLIHYGSYEKTFFRTMCERYGGPEDGSVAAVAIAGARNLVSFMFAAVYFPTYSNGLKDIAGWLGYRWSSGITSGIESLIWRVKWELSKSALVRQRLITYNEDDCRALQGVTESLARIASPTVCHEVEAAELPEIVQTSSPSFRDGLWGPFSSPVAAFEEINRAAKWDYQRNRVYVRSDDVPRRSAKAKAQMTKRSTRINKEMTCEPMLCCPSCGKTLHRKGLRSKKLYDIRFSRFGVRRWVVMYHFATYWCYRCKKYFGEPEPFWSSGIVGRNVVVFVVFGTIDLCMPQRAVTECLNRLFGLGLQQGVVHRLKAGAAEYYADTRAGILAGLVRGNLIHADETPIVLKKKRGYVWVLAGFRSVVYYYSETREADFVHELLAGFKGVLVSDFYAAYDSVPCSQQKCLIHLVRDLNDAVLDDPYDEDLRNIVTDFADLIGSIVKTIDRWGLKRRFLGKHLVGVDRFYRKLTKSALSSEVALKWRERFVGGRETLFTFLKHDGVPWNNNNAERAIKAFARLRRTIVGLSTPTGIDEYLILLSVCQTCRYSDVDFLGFLLSGEKDFDAFATRSRR